MFLFIRVLPLISIFEMRELVAETEREEEEAHEAEERAESLTQRRGDAEGTMQG
jgi:hypothetical protein